MRGLPPCKERAGTRREGPRASASRASPLGPPPPPLPPRMLLGIGFGLVHVLCLCLLGEQSAPARSGLHLLARFGRHKVLALAQLPATAEGFVESHDAERHDAALVHELVVLP